jgi:hypothetical protein
MSTSPDGPRARPQAIVAVAAAPGVADARPSSADGSEAATPYAELIAAELESALALCRAGADPKTLRRALRRIEELLDE